MVNFSKSPAVLTKSVIATPPRAADIAAWGPTGPHSQCNRCLWGTTQVVLNKKVPEAKLGPWRRRGEQGFPSLGGQSSCGLVPWFPCWVDSITPEQVRGTPSVASESPRLYQGPLPTMDLSFHVIQGPIWNVLFILAVTPSPASRRQPAHSCRQLLEREDSLFTIVHRNNVCSRWEEGKTSFSSFLG